MSVSVKAVSEKKWLRILVGWMKKNTVLTTVLKDCNQDIIYSIIIYSVIY